MGVKIEKAIHNKTNHFMTNYEADNQELNGEKFTCPYCKKALIFRRSGKRQLENRVINISPYFRLQKGIEHEQHCKYNTFGQVEIIARKPLALKDFMEKQKVNQYALRLQVVKEAMTEKPEEDNEPSSIILKGKRDTEEKKFKNIGSMAPYLSRMKEIMILRSKMEENKDIKKHIKLEYKSKIVNWDKFYFGPEYKDYLVLSKYFRNKPDPKHPICIEGLIKEYQKKTDRNNKEYYSFTLEKPYVNEKDTEGFKHIPSVNLNIYMGNIRLVDYMKENYKNHKKQIIAYGEPYVKVNTSAEYYVKYHNITIWINRTAQVHLFNNVHERLFD